MESTRCFVVVTLLGALACGTQTPGILDERLSNGALVRDSLQPGELHAILVYDATACFSCGSQLPFWREVARKQNVVVHVLLAGTLGDGDLRAMHIQRVPLLGSIRSSAPAASQLPSEYLVRDGVVLAARRGFDEVRRHSLWRQVDSLLDAEAMRGAVSQLDSQAEVNAKR